ncbi:MAG: mannose-1-phosphate guanylyltransferase/mannose-6-phosphate isomerase [Bdellovibrionales bacterium]|nr:mannose-1-phosphate guanylyltransferase/mannose-6-phosphate isomerase [Bdellovibrionales bacterium]
MIPVIMSGGSGTRLWPVSRASYPKQFCEFFDSSFLDITIKRLKTLGEVNILTVASMKDLTTKSALKESLDLTNLIFEPFGKNTAPAIALLCRVMEFKNKTNEVVGVFPADHLILDEEKFLQAVSLADLCAQENNIVTIGIQPTRPDTGYGYIEVQLDQVNLEKEDLKSYSVKAFHEKPTSDKAQFFMNEGRYYWNAGMFVFKVSTMIESFKKHQPDLWSRLSELQEDFSNIDQIYANLESESIDYAIMEKVKNQVCIPCHLSWSDVGSWEEIARLGDEIPDLKLDTGVSAFSKDAQNNFLYSIKNKVVGLVGVSDLIVVDTPDALLVAKKGKSQGIKDIVADMKSMQKQEATRHPFEKRPWGTFEVLADEKSFKAKTITVDVGGQLSYQSHEKRSEHWVIVEGKAEITLDDEIKQLTSGQSIGIPSNHKHRIKNVGSSPLVFVEVQTGEYFGEDDITRYEDIYGRK